MGDVVLPVPGQEHTLFSEYMTRHLVEVVEDWVIRAEVGGITTFMKGARPITAEHVRIAKLLFTKDTQRVSSPVPQEVIEAEKSRSGED